MALADIPVVATSDSSLSGNAPILLREIGAHIRHLLETGVNAAIDLQAMPLTTADRSWLKDKLGKGEIAITLEADGQSLLEETGCQGVWWVVHRNEKGAVMSEFIEMAFVPELVKAHPADIQSGLEHLELLISELC
jgi:hydrogenase-1 operon protein HyaF